MYNAYSIAFYLYFLPFCFFTFYFFITFAPESSITTIIKTKNMDKMKKAFASKLLKIKAIKLQPNDPFTWASGWKSPFYCDNRKTLSFPELRNYVKHTGELPRGRGGGRCGYRSNSTGRIGCRRT